MKIRAAAKFFAYIGRHFPVMCACGVFEFMPPVADAAQWLDRFDDLSGKRIPKHVDRLTSFAKDFEAAAAKAKTPEDSGLAQALSLSARAALTELDAIRTWSHAPQLYLHVAFTGLQQAADMPSKTARSREKRFLKRLKAVPGFLALAPDNIEAISPTHRATAQTMIRDCARYLTELGESDLGRIGKAPTYLDESLKALRDFDRFVAGRVEVTEEEGPSFERVAADILGTDKSPREIYEIAEAEYNHRIEQLQALESEIGAPWRTALESYEGAAGNDADALDVIVREIHCLRGFVFDSALPGSFGDSGLRIVSQPRHLASTLRPIHYDPALGAWPDEPSRCYVSPQLFTGRGFRDDPARLGRMRREYLFMAARQTYPGRHLLDTQRRAMGDSPLSQITNPLFMAGWLALAENLLEELGYLESPLDRLVHHHRGLARAALGMIDAGLAVGDLDQDRCLAILDAAGYSREESLNRVRAIRLSPGTRVRAVLGLHELTRLRQESGLDIDPFCTRLFASGQLPFPSLRRVLSA